jgi:hypothetical protein
MTASDVSGYIIKNELWFAVGKVRSSVWEGWGESGVGFFFLLFSVVVVVEGGLVSGLLLCGICFMIRLNMGLCVPVFVPFICSFCALRLCVQKRSHIFRCGVYPLFKYNRPLWVALQGQIRPTP